MSEQHQLELFPNCGVPDCERLYLIGNGFDLHHGIKSKYSDFEEYVRIKGDTRLISLMDTFFSNDRDFWGDIETALGEYNESTITEFCEPGADEDSKFEHRTGWQAGIEDSIPYLFGSAMSDFRTFFDNWVRSIEINGIRADLDLPLKAKYLSFNYTETLEKVYGIPAENVLHIHGSRLKGDGEFVIGHGLHRDVNSPFDDDSVLLPYQNAYSEVIEIMNTWYKDSELYMSRNKDFFSSLNKCTGVCIIGHSYNDIDFPYLEKVSQSVVPGCMWILKYYSIEDYKRAKKVEKDLGLSNCWLSGFE